MLQRYLAALVFALCLPFALPLTPASAQPATAHDGSVSHGPETDTDPFGLAETDLPVDPDFHLGTLANGMRYIIRPNATPPERGAVWLWVEFGSVAEGEEQQGWAHFIEHMAFNGSTNIAEGEMIKLLEREGLAFGADTNASTGFDVTSYRLDLPRNDLALLDTALMLMRETASELTFEEEAVERERGIILSEMRVRNTFALRSAIDNFSFLYPGSRISQRLPIGTLETIENATGAAMKALWQTYYRPENVTLIVAGDYDAQAVEQAITAHFADWQGAPKVPLPEFGPIEPGYQGATDIYIDPALSEQLTITRHGPYQPEPDTVASRQESILRQIGYRIINRRLARLARLGDPAFRGAALGTSDFFDEGRSTTLTIAAAEGEWQRGMDTALDEYRRALQFGFTEAEIAEQVATILNAVETAASGAATRQNSAFVNAAVALVKEGRIPTTPQSALDRFNAMRDQITPQSVLAALKRDIIPLDNPLIRFTGRSAPQGGKAALRAAWDEGMQRAITPPEEQDMAAFSYTDFGPAGLVTSQEQREDLGITQLTFANGLKLNLKPTDLQADRILLQLNVDGGALLNTRDDPLATAMTSSLPVGGLGAHEFDALQSILAGRQVSFNVNAAAETFRFGAQTTRRDLELQLQLLAAALLDPGFRPEGEVQYRRGVTNWYARRDATPEQALFTALGSIISDNDPRFSLQEEEAYLALNFARLRENIADRFASGAMELAIVGDFDETEAIALVAKTLGALPQRESSFRAYDNNRDRTFTADRSARTIYHDGAPDQAIVRFVWPTRDDDDHRASSVLDMLRYVMRIQLLDIVREELGQTYSPSVSANQSSVYDDYGTFALQSAVDIGDVDATRQAMLRALDAVRTQTPSADLMQRARQPILERLEDALDTNAGWMRLVDRAQTQTDRIERFLAAKDILASITPQEVQAAAQRYLDPAERLELLVLPRAQQSQE